MQAKTCLTINVGPPRTATTTLQIHFFPTLDQYYVLQKKPYVPSIETAQAKLKPFLENRHGVPGLSASKLRKYIVELGSKGDQRSSEQHEFMFSALWAMATFATDPRIDDRSREIQKVLIQQVLTYCIAAASTSSASGGLLLTSESLGSSFAALRPNKHKLANRKEHLADVIAGVWSEEMKGPAPRISFCLREPVGHISSRYIRYCVNCARINMQQLSPADWVACQVAIDKQNRAQSALFPAFHSGYIKYFNRIGYTRAYGFKELIHSQDLCSLLGLEGQKGIRFSSFPRENSLITDQSSRESITSGIRNALVDHGYLALLEKEQLFE